MISNLYVPAGAQTLADPIRRAQLADQGFATRFNVPCYWRSESMESGPSLSSSYASGSHLDAIIDSFYSNAHPSITAQGTRGMGAPYPFGQQNALSSWNTFGLGGISQTNPLGLNDSFASSRWTNQPYAGLYDSCAQICAPASCVPSSFCVPAYAPAGIRDLKYNPL